VTSLDTGRDKKLHSDTRRHDDRREPKPDAGHGLGRHVGHLIGVASLDAAQDVTKKRSYSVGTQKRSRADGLD
jgi:hypothetical protein